VIVVAQVDVWERIILGILKQESEIVPVPIPTITRARRAISGDKPATRAKGDAEAGLSGWTRSNVA
jgi:hypothetical protein